MLAFSFLSVCLIAEQSNTAIAESVDSEFENVNQIGGPTQAIAAKDNYAYTGIGLSLIIIDTSNPANLNQIGSTKPLGGYVTDIALHGNYAYLAIGEAGFGIVDISDPINPALVSNLTLPDYAEGIAITGNYAYVACANAGLRIIDISNPFQPMPIGTALITGYAFDVAVYANFAYVASAGSGLKIIDISNSTNPVEISSFGTTGYAYGLTISNNIVYVADGWGGVQFIDVTLPNHPTQLGVYNTSGWAFDIAVTGSIAFIADAYDGLCIIDISNPQAPVEISTYLTKGHFGRIFVIENTAFIADRNNGLRVIDVTDLIQPNQIGFYGLLGYARDVKVNGNFAYIAAASYGFRIVDISDIYHPKQVATIETPSYAIDVEISGNYAYVAMTGGGSNSGILIIDISNPTNPQTITIYENNIGGAYRDMELVNQLAYIPNEIGLGIINLNDVANPTCSGFISLSGIPVGVAVSGNYAYVADSELGMKIIDVSNPSNPVMVSTCNDLNFTQDVFVESGIAYAADYWGVGIVNVSDPTTPELISYCQTADQAYGVFANGTNVYVSCSGGGVNVVDVSNLVNPLLTGSYDTLGNTHGVYVNNLGIFIADGNGGLLTLSGTSMENQIILSKDLASIQTENACKLTSQRIVTTVMSNSNILQDNVMLNNELRDERTTQDYYPQTQTTWLVTNSDDDGTGTLRWAVQNAQQGDTINFDTATFKVASPTTIYLTSQLYIYRNNVTIDASNAGVILDGSYTSTSHESGIVIASNFNVIKGLVIYNFPDSGIYLHNAKGNMILNNTISGNGAFGIVIYGLNAQKNVVKNNLVGLDATGTKAIGNTKLGIFIQGGIENVIGGILPAERNVISGNGETGVGMQDGASKNVVIGNYLGTDITGSFGIGNNGSGVSMELGASCNLVKYNLASGNGRSGVSISDYGSDYNVVVSNLIGTDFSGTSVIGNKEAGVFCGFMGGVFNVIGGKNPADRNIISGNLQGIWLSGGQGQGNFVLGNYVGTDITGTKALGNTHEGISVNYVHSFVGGTMAAERNVVCANGNGICIGGFAAEWNSITGNYVGMDATGRCSLPNEGCGISLASGAKHNYLRGNLVGDNNSPASIVNAASNVIFENNFINEIQMNAYSNKANLWSLDGIGNFWNDYDGVDSNGDCIGDTPYNIVESDIDNYPLVYPHFWNYSTPLPVLSGGTTHYFELKSNSSICQFSFNKLTSKIILDIKGAEYNLGYCNITIPRGIVDSPYWIITVDDNSPQYSEVNTGEVYSTVNFTYYPSYISRIVIQAISIPESTPSPPPIPTPTPTATPTPSPTPTATPSPTPTPTPTATPTPTPTPSPPPIPSPSPTVTPSETPPPTETPTPTPTPSPTPTATHSSSSSSSSSSTKTSATSSPVPATATPLPSASPTVPELSILILLPIFALLFVGAILIKIKKRC